MTHSLLGIRAENYKRLELVNIEFPPGGGAFAIMGANEAGKSSTLDAIETAIAGRKSSALKAAKPIHEGADVARIVATFDDIIVTRTFKGSTTSIVVTGKDGRRFNNTEEILSALYSHVALDPLAFSRLSDKEQVDTLLPLIGFDPAPLEAKRQEAFDLRTPKGRERDAAVARLAGMPDPIPGLPDEEVSVATLSTELEDALAHNEKIAALSRSDDAAALSVTNWEQNVANRRQALADLEAEYARRLAQAKADVAEWERELERANEEALVAHTAFTSGPEIIDPEPIRLKIATAEETNRGIRARAARAIATVEVDKLKAEYDAYTATIAQAVADKAAALAAAKMPVPHLSIDPEENILTLGGIPFSQASTGVKIRTGAAIAMALNPDLALIIIRDASLLDGANREAIDALAKDNEFLVVMEIADESSPLGVVLEDGAVREVRA